jgi:Xaa-Pro aminopeptidase
MHRTGHWLGMDVHDCGYVEPGRLGQVKERKKDALSGERSSRTGQPHPAGGHGADSSNQACMCAPAGVPEQSGTSIRIGDDAIVTDTNEADQPGFRQRQTRSKR